MTVADCKVEAMWQEKVLYAKHAQMQQSHAAAWNTA